MQRSAQKANKASPHHKKASHKSVKNTSKRRLTTLTKPIATKTRHLSQQHSLTPHQQYSTPSHKSTPLKSSHAQFTTTTTHFTPVAPRFQLTPLLQPTVTMLAPFSMAKRTAMTFKKVGVVAAKPVTAEDLVKDKEAKVVQQAAKAKKVPSLNDVMRQLYKKIHPDLMMDYPEQKEQNEKSLGTFQNFLGQLKNIDGNEKYPGIKNASLPFYLRTATPGHFQRVELFLHTDATFNKKGIEKQLCNFFKSINLGSQFRWDDEYFPFKGKPDFKKEEGAEGGAEGEDGSSSTGPTGSETYDQFMERIKKEGQQNQNTTSM